MKNTKNNKRIQTLPLLPLRGLTVFPHMILTFDVGREKSIKALDEAMLNNQLIFLVTQKDAQKDYPDEEDLYKVGTISRVKQLLRLPGNTIRVLVEGVSRAEIISYVQYEPFFTAQVCEKVILPEEGQSIELEAMKRKLVSTFDDYARLSGRISVDTVLSLGAIDDIGQLTDTIASNMLVKVEQKQIIMDEFHPKLRTEKLLGILLSELEILEVEKNISQRIKKQIDKTQREYYLREQMKAIQSELGDREGVAGEVEEYKEKLMKANLPKRLKRR